MDRRVKDFLKKKEIYSMNGEIFQYSNHLDDNSVLFHFSDVLNGYGHHNLKKVVGYSEHPAFERDDDVGVMFEAYDGEEVWCHVPSVYFEPDSSYFKEII